MIVGAGNLGTLLYDCLEGDDRWNVIGFVDENKAESQYCGVPVFRPDAFGHSCRKAFLAVGSSSQRRALVERLHYLHFDWQTFIDRRCYLSSAAHLGQGSVVFPFASIGPGTSIGRFSYVGVYGSVGIHAKLGDYSTLLPRASAGNCSLGNGCTIGFNSACLDGAALEDDVIIGPYTLIRKFVPGGSFVAGSPPRRKQRESASQRL